MKVLFATHNLGYADHVAVAYLSGIAKQLGHSTYFCTLEREKFCNTDLQTAVLTYLPDVVAYSVNIFGFEKAVRAHKRIKNLHPFVSILGGPQATFSPETFNESSMDAYCVGEGEYVFRDFLNCLSGNTSFEGVPNLITSRGINEVRPLIKDLGDLPPANRDLVISNSLLKDIPKKTFYTSRGCPFKCSYCCNDYYQNLYKGKGPIVRKFPVFYVIEEMKRVKAKYRMNFIRIGDDCFAFKVDDWLQEFCEVYPKEIGIPFSCYLRLDLMEGNILSLLKKAGCFSGLFSIDSTSKHVREEVLKRKMRPVDLVEKLRLVKSYGINTFVNYMLAAPESTLQDDLETIELSAKGGVTYTHYTTTSPMQKTSLYSYCVDKGLLDLSTYKSDMEGMNRKSELTCFSEKGKGIQFNINLLGSLIAKLPKYLRSVAILLLKVIPPNKLFVKIRRISYQYYMERVIYKLK